MAAVGVVDADVPPELDDGLELEVLDVGVELDDGAVAAGLLEPQAARTSAAATARTTGKDLRLASIYMSPLVGESP